MFRINTNVLAINGQRNLFQTSKDLNTRMERLSSGLRINHAADDAAGITASETMRAQIAGQKTANDNMSRAITLLQTADSGLEQIGNMLIRLKELAEQSADSTLNADNRSGLSTEAAALVLEIDRIASSTTFNGISLIDSVGATNLTFYVGDGTPGTAAANQVVALALKGVALDAAGLGSIGGAHIGLTVADFLIQSSAEALVPIIDAAVTTLATVRTDVGAFQNRLERSQANIQSAIENTTRSESTIRDADFALEASAMTRAQILAQTGASSTATSGSAAQMQMQAKMTELQQSLEAKKISASSGGGMVTATVDGKGSVKQVQIDPTCVDSSDVEMLEDLVLAAVNKAQTKAQAEYEGEMKKVTGGLPMNIPGLPKLF